MRFADWLTIEYRHRDSAVDCLSRGSSCSRWWKRHPSRARRRSAAGTIRIRAAVENDELVLRVSDDGVGLARRGDPAADRSRQRTRATFHPLRDDRLRLLDGPNGVTAEVRARPLASDADCQRGADGAGTDTRQPGSWARRRPHGFRSF